MPLETESTFTVKKSPLWISRANSQLTQQDREILESDDAWFPDSVINAVQCMLKRDYPHVEGLADVCLLELPTEIKPFKRGRFVQVLINLEGGRKNHWFTISNMCHAEDTVAVYDSRADSVADWPLDNLNTVFYMMPYRRKLKVVVEQVTQQVDMNQCGPMCLAFAKALCSGRNPADIQFSDDPRILRDHVIQCLLVDRIRSFPTGSRSPILRTELVNDREPARDRPRPRKKSSSAPR